jgi:predicted CxxxxCH...CXXCH cytochrome family protein
VHLGLNTPSNPNGTPVSCSTCHNGLTSRTLEHYNRAKSRVAPGDVAFLATYNAQSGASSFLSSAFTCGNVSCHGGTSPNWRSGVIDPNTQCTVCHKSSAVAPPQFNDYRAQAGQNGHQDHLGRTNPVVGGRLIICTDCHNTARLADPALGKHFLNLSTSAFEGLPSSTVAGTGTYVNSYTAGTRSCAPDCHSNETWPP